MNFKVLDEKGIRNIHNSAVMMLESIGMDITGEKPRNALLEAGAKEKNGRILIGADLIEKALAHVPRHGFELVGRDPSRRVRVVPGEVHFRPAGGLPFVIDYPSQQRRTATMKDIENIARVVDALDGIDIVNSAASPSDIGVGIKNVRRFVNAIQQSTKPTDITVSSSEEVATIYDISLVIKGNSERLEREPLVVVYVSPTSPLRLSENEALATMECAKKGLPMATLSCPTLVATAPATIAGGIALSWAEQISQIVLAYTIRPGLPIVVCSRLNPADMRSGSTILSGAATGLATTALTEVAAFFGLPANGWGFTTSSHSVDLQAGAERMLGALLAALAGTSIISGAGTLDNALVSTPEQMVIDNELIGIIRHAIGGVKVSRDTLASDFIAEGAQEGTFMMCSHTIEHLRNGSIWMADLFNTEQYETWVKEKTDLISRARTRVKEILCVHEVTPIDRAKQTEIDSILKAAGVQ